jgi:hypothetical protein
MFTLSGEKPRPAIWVKKPMLASTLYVPGLNSSAYLLVPNWLRSCWLKIWFSRPWIVAWDIDGSKTNVFGPRSMSPDGGGLLPTGASVKDWAALPLHVYCCSC